MHVSIIVAGLSAALAAAKPLDKRVIYTHVHTVTTWTTVTAAPNSVAGDGYGYRPEASTTPADAAPSSQDTGMAGVDVEESDSEIDEPVVVADEEFDNENLTDEELALITGPSPEQEVATGDDEPSDTEEEPSAGEFAEQDSTQEGSYEDMMLEAHNVHRANHMNTEPLTWSNKLAATAEKQIASCRYAHDMDMDIGSYSTEGNNPYGQNIGWHSEDEPWGSIHAMYNDEKGDHTNSYAGDSLPSDYERYDHLTQIVWQETKEVGCATKFCESLYVPPDEKTGEPASTKTDKYQTFCNYFPPGNMGGKFDNVGAPLGNPEVGMEYSDSYTGKF